MPSPQSDTAQDIAWLRSLAEDGANRPLVAGPFLAAAGVIFGAASLVCWGLVNKLVPFSASNILTVWIAASGLYAVVLGVLLRQRTGTQTRSNRAINSAWTILGASVLVFWAGITITAVVTGSAAIFASMPIMVLTLYGLVWWVSADVSGRAWLKVPAIASFASVPLVAVLSSGPHLFLGYAVALILSVLAPGLYMMREERAA